MKMEGKWEENFLSWIRKECTVKSVPFGTSGPRGELEHCEGKEWSRSRRRERPEWAQQVASGWG